MKTSHNYYVYIVQCSDGSYYAGVTNDLERRLWEHETGYNEKCYTFIRRPIILKYHEHFHDISNAIAWEKQLKGWSRKKKEALFKGDWEEIKKLAKSRLRQAQPDKPPTNQSDKTPTNQPDNTQKDHRDKASTSST